VVLTHLSLFSGIGGIGLGAEWAGFETVCFVEKDAYCQKVLRKHWPDVPVVEDIHGFTWGEPATLVTGGFPCQPVSVAGQRRGTKDDRWLWPEMLRVIKEILPSHVCAENVAGLTTMVEQHRLVAVESRYITRTEDEDVFSAVYTHEETMQLFSIDQDLTDAGYWTEYYLVPACAVNAPHRRDRIFIVAHAGCVGDDGRGSERRGQGGAGPCDRTPRSGEHAVDVADTSGFGRGEGRAESERQQRRPGSAVSSGDVADADREGPQGHGGLGECGGQWLTWTGSAPLEGIWESEPPVGRVASGIPKRVDRLKCLGNAVVPQQIYPILKAIVDNETKRMAE